MASSINMSLDSLINKRQGQNGQRGKGKGKGKRQQGGAARGDGIARGTRQKNVPYQPKSGANANTTAIFGLAQSGGGPRGRGQSTLPISVQSGGIMSRVGAPVKQGGTKVIISNLGPNVTESDVKSLCEEKGEVYSALLKFNNHGQSTGVAAVVFAQASKAQEFILEFQGRLLDEQPLRIKLASMNPKMDNPLNAQLGVSSTSFDKASLFGTKLQGNRADSGGFKNTPRSQVKPKFEIIMDAPKSVKNQNQKQGKGKGAKGIQNKPQPKDHVQNPKKGKGERKPKPASKTQAELDAEMESYFLASKAAPAEAKE